MTMFALSLPSKRNGGFTLIELLVVVLIIGVLAAIALPQYLLTVEKARAAEAMTLVKQIAEANKRYRLLNGQYTNDIRELELDQDFPGEPTENGGVFTRRTKYFDYRATAAGTPHNPDGSTGIAVVRRLDNGDTKRQYAVVVYPENRISCSPHTDCKICSALGY
jgi:prepilin-type N-terminal cleavage/methylation domain-containing protein